MYSPIFSLNIATNVINAALAPKNFTTNTIIASHIAELDNVNFAGKTNLVINLDSDPQAFADIVTGRGLESEVLNKNTTIAHYVAYSAAHNIVYCKGKSLDGLPFPYEFFYDLSNNQVQFKLGNKGEFTKVELSPTIAQNFIQTLQTNFHANIIKLNAEIIDIQTLELLVDQEIEVLKAKGILTAKVTAKEIAEASEAVLKSLTEKTEIKPTHKNTLSAKVNNAVNKIAKDIKNAAVEVKEAAKEVASDVKNAVKPVAKDVKEAAKEVASDVKNAVKPVAKDVKNAAADVKETVKDATAKAQTQAQNTISKTISQGIEIQKAHNNTVTAEKDVTEATKKLAAAKANLAKAEQTEKLTAAEKFKELKATEEKATIDAAQAKDAAQIHSQIAAKASLLRQEEEKKAAQSAQEAKAHDEKAAKFAKVESYSSDKAQDEAQKTVELGKVASLAHATRENAAPVVENKFFTPDLTKPLYDTISDLATTDTAVTLAGLANDPTQKALQEDASFNF